MPLICLKIILSIWSWKKPNQNKSPLPQFKFKFYFPHLSMLDFVFIKVPLNPRHFISHMHIYTFYRNLLTLVTKTADFTIRIPMYLKTLFIPYQKNCSVLADNAKLICSLLKDKEWVLGSKKNICKYFRWYRARKELQK